MKKNNISTTVLVILVLLLHSCGASKSILSEETNKYPGTLFLSNGGQISGIVSMPPAESKSVKCENISYSAKEIDSIVFNVQSHRTVLCYMPVKGTFGKISNYWLARLVKGPHTSAYIGGVGYTIDSDGDIGLVGYETVMINSTGGRTTIQPSFSVYMEKSGDKALSLVTLRKGINFEGSAFRSGISRFLADDPLLCEYVRRQKWDFDNLGDIVKNYTPNRGEAGLTINGETVTMGKRSLLTNDLNNEMLLHIEIGIPSNKNYGTQFALGIRSSFAKFISYGADVGYASATIFSESEYLDNHGLNTSKPIEPATDADFIKNGLFRFNTFLGVQLPFDLKKLYLIPAAHISFGGMLGSEYDTLNYGPMFTLDLGFKLGHGDILLIGGGLRRNIPLANKEVESAWAPADLETYKPYNNLLFRVAYKF